jgi:hypothetical protein
MQLKIISHKLKMGLYRPFTILGHFSDHKKNSECQGKVPIVVVVYSTTANSCSLLQEPSSLM